MPNHAAGFFRIRAHGGILTNSATTEFDDCVRNDTHVPFSHSSLCDHVLANPRAQHFGHNNAAVSLLVVFQHRDDRAGAGDGGAVEGLNELSPLLSGLLQRMFNRRA